MQQIYVSSTDSSFRGPFSDSPAVLSGETVVTLTDAQYAQLCSVRQANSTIHRFKWDGSTVSVHPIETLRAGLISQYEALSAYDQALFQPVFVSIKERIDAGDMAGAKAIISSGHDLNATIAAAQTSMLALFPA